MLKLKDYIYVENANNILKSKWKGIFYYRGHLSINQWTTSLFEGKITLHPVYKNLCLHAVYELISVFIVPITSNQ